MEEKKEPASKTYRVRVPTHISKLLDEKLKKENNGLWSLKNGRSSDRILSVQKDDKTRGKRIGKGK